MSLLNTHLLLSGQPLPKPAGGGGNVINAVPRFEQRAILAELKKMGISPNQLEAVPGSNKQLIRFKHGNNWIVVTTVGLLAALTLINEYGPGGMAQFRRMQRINGQLSHAGRQLNIPLAVVLGDNDVSPNFITAAEQNVLDNFNRALRANGLSAEGFSQLVQNNINSIHRIEENVQHAVNTRPTDAGGGQVAERTQALANLTNRINRIRLGELQLPVSATGQREGTNYVIRITVPGGRTPGGLIKPISPERFGQEMAAISNRTQALENWANNNYQGRPQGWTLDETQLQDPESVMRAVLGLPSLQNPQHGTPLRPQPLPPNAPVASGRPGGAEEGTQGSQNADGAQSLEYDPSRPPDNEARPIPNRATLVNILTGPHAPPVDPQTVLGKPAIEAIARQAATRRDLNETDRYALAVQELIKALDAKEMRGIVLLNPALKIFDTIVTQSSVREHGVKKVRDQNPEAIITLPGTYKPEEINNLTHMQYTLVKRKAGTYYIPHLRRPNMGQIQEAISPNASRTPAAPANPPAASLQAQAPSNQPAQLVEILNSRGFISSEEAIPTHTIGVHIEPTLNNNTNLTKPKRYAAALYALLQHLDTMQLDRPVKMTDLLVSLTVYGPLGESKSAGLREFLALPGNERVLVTLPSSSGRFPGTYYIPPALRGNSPLRPPAYSR